MANRTIKIGIEIPNIGSTVKSVDTLTKELQELIEVEKELNKTISQSDIGSQEQQDLVTSLEQVNEEVTKYTQVLENELPGAAKAIQKVNAELEETRKVALEAFSADRLIQFTGVASQALIGLNETFNQLSDGTQDAEKSIQRATQAMVAINAVRDSAEALVGFKNIVSSSVTVLSSATTASFSLGGAIKFLQAAINPTTLVLTALTGAFGYLVSISGGFVQFLDKVTSGFKAIFSSIATGNSLLSEYNRELDKIENEKRLNKAIKDFEILSTKINQINTSLTLFNRTQEEIAKDTQTNNDAVINGLSEQLKLLIEKQDLENNSLKKNELQLEINKTLAQINELVVATEKEKLKVKTEQVEKQKELNQLEIDNQIKGIQKVQEIIGNASFSRLKAIEKERDLTLSSLNNELASIIKIEEISGATDESATNRARILSQIKQTSIDFENKLTQEKTEINNREFELRQKAETTISELVSERQTNQINVENQLLDIEQQLLDLIVQRKLTDITIGTSLQVQNERRRIELEQVEDIFELEQKRLKNSFLLNQSTINDRRKALESELNLTNKNIKDILKLSVNLRDEIRLKELNTQKDIQESRLASLKEQETQAQLIYDASLFLLLEKFKNTINGIKKVAKVAGKDIAISLLDATSEPINDADIEAKLKDKTDKQLEATKQIVGVTSELIGSLYSILDTRISNSLNAIGLAKETAQTELEELNGELEEVDNRIKSLSEESKEASGQRADFLNAQLEKEIEQRGKVQASIQAQEASVKNLESQEQSLAQEREKIARQQARIQALAIATQSALALAQSITAITSTASQSGIASAITVPAVIGIIAAGLASVTSLVSAAKTFESGGLLEGNSHANGGINGTGSFANIQVEGGEFITNRRATKQFLPLLEKINSYQNGGILQPNDISTTPTQNPLNIQVSVVDIVQSINRVNVIDNLSNI